MQHTRSFDAAMPALQARSAFRFDRSTLGTKLRAARAILDLSQDEFAARVGLTQRSIHRIEQGSVEPKVRTIVTIEKFLFENGIAFEDLPNGGFRLVAERPSLADQKAKPAITISPLV